ncbi:MAG: late competence development ComFB family protein, partial [Cyanobacteria bacterium P01_A01_bin.114]
VAAYALNRLPPLYATTEEGANYQREKARIELADMITGQVQDAIANNLNRPDFFPERQTIKRTAGEGSFLGQMNDLLKDYAHKFEMQADVA